ncbi:hypothetical protein B0H13DRAFT_793583 [Mycena leptocephala]|nr:hypothetical protein B0H13DRAFT_793583 [Mycena leptocephala]
MGTMHAGSIRRNCESFCRPEPPRFSFAVTTISDFCQYAQGIPVEEYAGWCQALHARAAWVRVHPQTGVFLLAQMIRPILCPRIRLLLHMPMQMGHTTKITTSPLPRRPSHLMGTRRPRMDLARRRGRSRNSGASARATTARDTAGAGRR